MRETVQREVELLRTRESKLQLEVQELAARNRELELQLKVQELAARNRELESQLKVQELAARNRELESQLKVYKVAQPTLRAAEAEGARWCAPSFRLASSRGLAPAMPHRDARAPSSCMASLHARCVCTPGSLGIGAGLGASAVRRSALAN
jgi:hypothetical protein